MPPNGLTPYALNKDGTPVFSCSCQHNNDKQYGVKFTQLPNDPYNCHLEPCDFEHLARLWDPKTQECNCPAAKGGESIKSPVDGICRVGCQPGAWDPVRKRCHCDTISSLCSSLIYPREGEPACGGDAGGKCNPAGSYCSDPCEEKPCLNGGNCVYNSEHTAYECQCPADSSPIVSGKNYCGSGCKGKNTAWQWTGKNCGTKCVPSGGVVGTCTWIGGGGHGEWSCAISPTYGGAGACCSGSVEEGSDCEGGGGQCNYDSSHQYDSVFQL
jgi:hypothetical protein